MTLLQGIMRRPRAFGTACATGSVALGLIYLALAGAPPRYLLINGVALLIGLTLLVIAGRFAGGPAVWRNALMVAAAAALLATGLLGERVDGAARWVRVGGLFVQPSLVLLPLMIVAYAKTGDLLATVAMIVAAAALALQPDRAMAFMLAAALGVLTAMRPDRLAITALASGLAALAATLIQPDRLPAVPFVDGVFYSSFTEHVLAGAAVLGGSILLLLPALAGWFRDKANRAIYAALGITWLAAMVAAAVGNYPTPVVGYGGSAIIGYLLCLTVLPATVRSVAPVDAKAGDPSDSRAEGSAHPMALPATA